MASAAEGVLDIHDQSGPVGWLHRDAPALMRNSEIYRIQGTCFKKTSQGSSRWLASDAIISSYLIREPHRTIYVVKENRQLHTMRRRFD
jgi:hypothetical protein